MFEKTIVKLGGASSWLNAAKLKGSDGMKEAGGLVHLRP